VTTEANALLSHLTFLYGEDAAQDAFEGLSDMMARYSSQIPAPASAGLSQHDAILITYGDQVRQSGVPPLQALARFCEDHLQGVVSGVHILPFYPYSSDDGFSVVDYRQVDPALGAWEDVHHLGRHFRLMFDAVINHVSAHSVWFQAFLRGQRPYKDYFIVVEGQPDLSQVVRPRALPLLTRFPAVSGEKAVWTTFSADQIDLNYQNPQVLLEVLETLLFYVTQGAEFIRLDAIAYLWKEIGTTCIHLPQTHHMVQLFRAVLDRLAPHVQLITETNVPHAENISYFGDGSNEAQMVYNFALPPLVLHTFYTGNAQALTRWAASLRLPSERVTFFNFLASHDGIGVTPARGLISDAEYDTLVERALEHGGLVSYRSNPDGSQSPYELNINYFDALSNPKSDEPLQRQVERFVAAHAIMFALVGVPGIYFHSLFGSRSWHAGVALTGRNRSINRQKLDLAELEAELAERGSLRLAVFGRLAQLLGVRLSHAAFHPNGVQRVLEMGEKVFALLRTSPDGGESLLCLQNVSSSPVPVRIDLGSLPFRSAAPLVDLVTRVSYERDQIRNMSLSPYQVVWLASS
jgi:glucosylglycerate phosphorylase